MLWVLIEACFNIMSIPTAYVFSENEKKKLSGAVLYGYLCHKLTAKITSAIN